MLPRKAHLLTVCLWLLSIISIVEAAKRKSGGFKKKGTPEGDNNKEGEGTGFFFLMTLLACIVAPWTYVVVWNLLFPGAKTIKEHFPEKNEEGGPVKECQTPAMKRKRDEQKAEFRSRRNMFSTGYIIRLVILGLLWAWLLYICYVLKQITANSAIYADFDPYTLLDVGRMTSDSDIKKAYKKQSLKYHPDKNPEKDAAEKFMLIKKAYDALTDPESKYNYKMYGNPDGPQRYEMGTCIPMNFSKSTGLWILVAFVAIFVIGLPMLSLLVVNSGILSLDLSQITVYAIMQALEKLEGDCGEQEILDIITQTVESMTAFGQHSREGAYCLADWEWEACETIWKELTNGSTSFETKKSRLQGLRTGGDSHDSKFGPFQLRAEMALIAYLNRRNDLIPDKWEAGLKQALTFWPRMAQVIADAAMEHCSIDLLEASARIQRCLIQALETEPKEDDAKSLQMLQLPHFSKAHAAAWKKIKGKKADLRSFIDMTADERKKTLEKIGEEAKSAFSAEQLLDIEEVANHIPRLQVTHRLFTEGEDDNLICIQDFVTLEVEVERLNLRDGESCGSVHAPLFAHGAVRDSFYVIMEGVNPSESRMMQGRPLIFTASTGGSKGSVHYQNRKEKVKMKFPVEKLGTNTFNLHVVSGQYEGLDLEEKFTFQATMPPQGRRNSEVSNEESEED